MSTFRVETVRDPLTGKWSAELYYPSDATEPYAVTPSIFPSHDEAGQYAINAFKKTFDGPFTFTGDVPSSEG